MVMIYHKRYFLATHPKLQAIIWWFLLWISLKCLYSMFYISARSFSVHNYQELFPWLFFRSSQNLLCYKLFSGHFLSPSLSVKVPLCMICFSSLLMFFHLLHNSVFLTLVSSFFCIIFLACILVPFLPPFRVLLCFLFCFFFFFV